MDIFELERKEYLKDSKKLCLDSVYFAKESVETLRNSITEKLEYFWNNPMGKFTMQTHQGKAVWGFSQYVGNYVNLF